MNLAIDQVEHLVKNGVPVDMFDLAIYNYANLRSRVETHLKVVKGIFNDCTYITVIHIGVILQMYLGIVKDYM